MAPYRAGKPESMAGMMVDIIPVIFLQLPNACRSATPTSSVCILARTDLAKRSSG